MFTPPALSLSTQTMPSSLPHPVAQPVTQRPMAQVSPLEVDMPSGFRYPFGEVSCESEVEVLQQEYASYYYNQTRFNVEVTEPETYLIIGRRGAGKSSLAKYLEFQPVLKRARCIDVDEPHVYDELFRRIDRCANPTDDMLARRFAKLWAYLIWNLIFDTFQAEDPYIRAACLLKYQRPSPARLVADILKHLMSRFLSDDDGVMADELEHMLSSVPFSEGQARVLEYTAHQPVIVAIDTIERYDKNDDRMMGMMAGLVEAASRFNLSFAPRGIHVKVFISAEIFPHLKQSVICNTTKYIRNPVYLHWRPKDLIHLICWRFYRFLDERALLPAKIRGNVDWSSFDDVIGKMWEPFFGATLTNSRGMAEKTFPYLLRHTQMRPRQLVELCNQIARQAMKLGVFPDFTQIPIAEVVKETERELANEILNSYGLIYPHVSDIVDALQASPMQFEGSYLDKVAKRSIAAWPAGEYSPDNFRKLVAELGIVGRVRSADSHSKIIAADFEYASVDHLALQSSDHCVIHPMFYSRLNVGVEEDYVVYPFPNHPDYALVRANYYGETEWQPPELAKPAPSSRHRKPRSRRRK